jgi:hypothetical protein
VDSELRAALDLIETKLAALSRSRPVNGYSWDHVSFRQAFDVVEEVAVRYGVSRRKQPDPHD